MSAHIGGTGGGIPDPAVKVTNGGLIWNGSAWVNQLVGASSIAALAVGTGALANAGVTLAKLAAGAVDDSKVASGAAIAVNKLAGGTAGQVLTMVSGVPAWATASAGAPSAHEATHEAGGTDPLPWDTEIHAEGTAAARPAAAASNLGMLYFSTGNGIIWRSNGTIWEEWSWDAEWFLNGGPGVMIRTPYPRHGVRGDLALLASGVQTLVAVPMLQGDVVTNLTFFSGATAAGTPTHWWFSLYDPTLNKVGQTADQTTTAWAGNTAKTLALSGGPFTLTQSGVYYVGIMVAATTPPSLRAANVQHSIVNVGVTGQKPLGVDSGSALTATAPGTIVTTTSNIQLPYCVAS